MDLSNILFRASKISLLCSGLASQGLTQAQAIRLEELELRLITPRGLTDLQMERYELLESKEDKTSKEIAELDKLTRYLNDPIGHTEAQAKEYATLKEKQSATPQLTEGAKTYIRSVWLEVEKGYTEDIDTKEVRKGRLAEENSITLLSRVYNKAFVKNTKRQVKGNITGECDTRYRKDGKTIIRDIKSSYSPRTFMEADLKTEYYWQGMAYMYLYDADYFYLDYCLVDTPMDIYEDEYRRFCFNNNIIDDSLPKYAKDIERFNKRHRFTEGYTEEERVKTFEFERNDDDIAIMLQAVELALEYYDTLTLNRKPHNESVKVNPRHL